MARFMVNPDRFDPYKNFKFRVGFPGTGYIAGVSKISALKRTTEMVEHREGGDASSSHKSPGRTKYEAITMERGVTHDPEFEAWANRVWNYGNAQAAPDQRTLEVSLKSFRRELLIDVFNEAGQKVISYHVFRAWVSEFTAQADLDANANAILIQSIKVEHEGWQRDPSVIEPTEPQFDGLVVA
jgi:phage tail-like protein